MQTGYQIMEHIFTNFEPVPNTALILANEVLERKRSLQDFAHAIALCRCLGIPARYVSGYFYDPTGSKHERLRCFTCWD